MIKSQSIPSHINGWKHNVAKETAMESERKRDKEEQRVVKDRKMEETVAQNRFCIQQNITFITDEKLQDSLLWF